MDKRLLEALFVAAFLVLPIVHAQDRGSEWLYMVYLDGDNNLESYGVKDLNEMELGLASNSGVKVLVLFDGYSGRYIGHKGAKIYEVVHDTSASAVKSKVVNDLGEVNMGDPSTLTDFVDYCTSNYPASKHALVLWNHGAGWRELEEERTDITKDVCFDDTDGDQLSTEELSQVLPQISESCGSLDFLGFDACLMQMFELAYEYSDSVEVMAGSEETEPGDGWDYSYIMSELSSDPSMGAESLGKLAVDAYADYYGSDSQVTFSAIRASAVPELASAVSELSSALLNALPTERSAISSARNASLEFAYSDYIDLYNFAANLRTQDTAVMSAAAGVMDAVDSSMISEWHSSDYDAHGVSIWFNRTYPSQQYMDRYENLRVSGTGWLDFLLAYYG
jgi:hypothetical protein